MVRGSVFITTLAVLLVLFSTHHAYAVSGTVSNASSCNAIGGTWNGSTNTCSVNGFIVNFGDEVIIPGSTTILNTGLIHNAGTLDNRGVLNSSGTINNFRVLQNTGTMNNFGIINNKVNNGNSIMLNFGIINNAATITNAVTIQNSGIINNECEAIYTGNAPLGNPINNIPCIVDFDFDGVSDTDDNCPAMYNPAQDDTDDDGVGDACDPTPNGDQCTPGTYSVTGFEPCIQSPVGTFVDAGGAVSATQCSIGTYQSLSGQTSCLVAQAGAFVDVVGATNVTQCPIGTYQPNEGQASCIPADVGHYVPTSGSNAQLECQLGYYQGQMGQTLCTSAPSGAFVNTTGASEATQCQLGTYQPNTGSTSCILSDPGSFVDAVGAQTQTQCPIGTFQSLSGQAECILAEPGFYVPEPGAAEQLQCPTGTSSESGASGCTPISIVLSATKDSFLRKGAKNTNEGQNSILMVQKAGNKRTLISFDLSEYSGQHVSSAKLRLYVTYNGGNWGKHNDRMIEIHQLLSDWIEGNGANFVPKNIDDDDEPEKNRGSASGVTWNCNVDSNISNKKADCDNKWDGATFSPTVIDSVVITKTTINQWVEFDLTDNVQSILSGESHNYGWAIKKSNEQNSGRIAFASSENDNLPNRPQLVLKFGNTE